MSFDDFTKRTVWNKGRIIPKYNSDEWRLDRDGKVIRWRDHGNRQSKYGWEIHHVRAAARGGSDALSNLIPLHWETNARLGGGMPS